MTITLRSMSLSITIAAYCSVSGPPPRPEARGPRPEACFYSSPFRTFATRASKTLFFTGLRMKSAAPT